MDSTPDFISDEDGLEQVRPLRDRDATAPDDPADDPAQAEWERTDARDSGVPDEEPSAASATGPGAEGTDDDEEIPAEDLPAPEVQPETQGADPVIAELGEEGEGDLSPEDV